MNQPDNGVTPRTAGVVAAIRARAHATAREMLALMGQTGPYPLYLTAQTADGRGLALLVIASPEDALPGTPSALVPMAMPVVAAAAQAILPPMTPTQRKLYGAATANPECAKKLCALAGVVYNSRAKEAVAWLTRARLLTRLPEGLARP